MNHQPSIIRVYSSLFLWLHGNMMGFNPRMFGFIQGANLFVERAHIHTYVRACVRTYYIRACIRTYVRTYVHTYIHRYLFAFVLAFVFKSIFLLQIYTYILLYVYIYANINLCENMSKIYLWPAVTYGKGLVHEEFHQKCGCAMDLCWCMRDYPEKMFSQNFSSPIVHTRKWKRLD